MVSHSQHELAKVNWPTKLSVLLHIGALVVISQLVMFLDNARGIAYVVLPVLVLHNLFRESNISLKRHFKMKISLFVLSLVWVTFSFLTLAQVISIEHGDPMINEGFIYEMTSRMART
ncbi:hypothetical protein [Rheinheimera sp.]|uniref:hypothetical protein n=1 Tax=Rheinheimera sp. TaxID=1869214 RepID=UPI004047156B